MFGLKTDEVLLSREKYGSNRLTEQKREGFFKKLLHNFADPMIIILCVALGINILFAILGKVAWYESVGIAAAVLIATLVSTFSEYRNENAFAKLQEESSKITCKVYRDGQITEVSIDDIVVGDAVLLQPGDKIPADGIIVEGNLQVDQSVLNGEAKEANKVPGDPNMEMGDKVDFLQENMIFRGSVVCGGNAVAIIKVVGDNTVYGKIADELQAEGDRVTPLKLKLGKLAKQISMFGYIGGIFIALAFIFSKVFAYNHFDWNVIHGLYFANWDCWQLFFSEVVEAIMLGVIIIVMAVPEGLPLMIAIVSSQNMRKMLRDNILVRKISGIETAGSLNILFSDKTGTITKGKLEVVDFINGDCEDVKTLAEVDKVYLDKLNINIIHNTTSVISVDDNNEIHYVGGNMTDRALLSFVEAKEKIAGIETTRSVSFTSANKYSLTVLKQEKDLVTYVKGAPEVILQKCSHYLNKDGKELPIKDNLARINQEIDNFAYKAIRVIALAYKKGDSAIEDGEFVLIGLLGIRDEIRPDAMAAIQEVKQAGVHIVMITGDRKETAVAIAREVGIIDEEHDIVLSSSELAELSDEELKEKINRIAVIARAIPSDKSRLVRNAQDLNLVAGMTGDGVNDSPALKKADVGFAMGSGTEVAKEAAEIVIMDDNFTSIGKAVLYGRTFFNSIRKFIVFQLTINVAAVLISFICPLVNIPVPLTITQILWVNLVIDTLAAIAFGGEPALSEYMREKPKRRDERIISGSMWSSILTGSLWVFALSMIMIFTPLKDVFKITFQDTAKLVPDIATDGGQRLINNTDILLTAYFTFFIFSAVFNAFNARTPYFNLFKHIRRNLVFLVTIGSVALVQVALTYLGNNIFQSYGLDGIQWLVVIGLAFTIIPIDLFRKFIVYLIAKRKANN